MSPLNLREAVYALSETLDLVGIDDRQHGKRVGYMARCCGERLGMLDEELDDLLAAGLLHDVGVSSTRMHARLVEQDDRDEADVHCEVGHRLLADCSLLAPYAEVVLYHHTPWDELSRTAVPLRVQRHANLIFLADRVDAALMRQRDESTPLQARSAVHAYIQEQRDRLFSADLVDAFRQASDNEAFWLMLEESYLAEHLREWSGRGERHELDHATLASLASIFANCVDAKSPYTAEHSQGVSRLAGALGDWVGLPPEQCRRLEIAGLLHDLGKLRVPDELLDKPGPLEPEEWALMKRHSFDTYRVLDAVSGLEDIAEWTSMHHEKLDGSGYPSRRGNGQLPLPARILAVADIFQALAQERPYRGSLPPDQIIAELRLRAGDGELDRYIVDLVASRAGECWDLAARHADGIASTAA